jgi:hypothetical protein
MAPTVTSVASRWKRACCTVVRGAAEKQRALSGEAAASATQATQARSLASLEASAGQWWFAIASTISGESPSLGDELSHLGVRAPDHFDVGDEDLRLVKDAPGEIAEERGSDEVERHEPEIVEEPRGVGVPRAGETKRPGQPLGHEGRRETVLPEVGAMEAGERHAAAGLHRVTDAQGEGEAPDGPHAEKGDRVGKGADGAAESVAGTVDGPEHLCRESRIALDDLRERLAPAPGIVQDLPEPDENLRQGGKPVEVDQFAVQVDAIGHSAEPPGLCGEIGAASARS